MKYSVKIIEEFSILFEQEIFAIDEGIAQLYIDGVLNSMFDYGYPKKCYTSVDKIIE